MVEQQQLDPTALLTKLPTLLPGDNKQLASSTDAVAAFVHTVFTSLSLTLVGVDDGDDAADAKLENNVLPEGWNDPKKGCITLRYKHEASVVTLKIMQMGRQTVINAISSGDDNVVNLSIPTNDYTSTSGYPLPASDSEKLLQSFISTDRTSSLVSQVMTVLIQPVVPNLHPRERSRLQEETSNQRAEVESRLRDTPAVAQPSRSILQEGEPRSPPSFNPAEIGRSDLDPLPAQIQPNPLQPSMMIPPRQGDGMYVGPNHPIFGGAFDGRRGTGRSPPGGPGATPFGGDGYLPPLGAPPGARFDPIVPFGVGSGVGPRPGGIPSGRAPQRSGDPDFDELLPPGFDNDGPPGASFSPPGRGGFGGGPRPPFGGSGGFGGRGGPMPPGAGDMFM